MKKNVFKFLIAVLGIFAFVNSADASPQYKFTRDLQHGSSGLDVALAQHCLARIAGVPKDGVDDYFSSRIKSRVVKIQRSFGLKPDGVIGHRTGKLMEEKCPDSSSDNKISFIKTKKLVKAWGHLNKKGDAFEIHYSFTINNGLNTDFQPSIKDNFVFKFNKNVYSANELAKVDGFSLEFRDSKGDKIKGSYLIRSGEKGYVHIILKFNSQDIDKGELLEYYQIVFDSITWKLDKKTESLPLSVTTEKIYLK